MIIRRAIQPAGPAGSAGFAFEMEAPAGPQRDGGTSITGTMRRATRSPGGDPAQATPWALLSLRVVHHKAAKSAASASATGSRLTTPRRPTSIPRLKLSELRATQFIVSRLQHSATGSNGSGPPTLVPGTMTL